MSALPCATWRSRRGTGAAGIPPRGAVPPSPAPLGGQGRALAPQVFHVGGLFRPNLRHLAGKDASWLSRRGTAAAGNPAAGARIKQDDDMKTVANRRVLEKYPNMKLLGSYFLYKDGKHYWYEVILADPSHPSIAKDKELRKRVISTAA